jgi:hypothetical protein
MRRNGWTLILAGVLGALFFWLTDPRYGYAKLWSGSVNPIDASNEAFFGTVVGVVCSVALLLIGVWLMRRKTL